MIDPFLQSKVIQAARRASSLHDQVDLRSLWELLSNIDPQAFHNELQNVNLEYPYGALPIHENPGLALDSM